MRFICKSYMARVINKWIKTRSLTSSGYVLIVSVEMGLVHVREVLTKENVCFSLSWTAYRWVLLNERVIVCHLKSERSLLKPEGTFEVSTNMSFEVQRSLFELQQKPFLV